MSATLRPATAQSCALRLMEYLAARRETVTGVSGLRIDHAMVSLRELYADETLWVPVEPQPDLGDLLHDVSDDVASPVHKPSSKVA